MKTAINLYAYMHRDKGVTSKRIDERIMWIRRKNAIKKLTEESRAKNKGQLKIVTTSKIRNLLAMTSDIYNQVLTYNSEKMDNDIVGRIEYLRIRVMYECGREPKVKEFVQKAEIIELLKEIGNSKKNYLLFSRYMEALVAFHKYYGGQD